MEQQSPLKCLVMRPYLCFLLEEPLDPPFRLRPNMSMGHQEFFRLFPAKCELKRAGFDVNLGLDLPIEIGVWPTRAQHGWARGNFQWGTLEPVL